ncbi:MAG: LCP family protein [Treponema sp.]|nr:LCP family protein [Treponema sp.]
MQRKNGLTAHDASIFLLVMIVFLLISGIVIAAFTLRSDPVEELLSNDRVISVLYVIEKDQAPLSTYVLMGYPKTRRAAVFDIPGELWMQIRRTNRFDRIDSEYESNRIANYKTAVENLLGVEVAFSIVITAENLGKAVDLIEGVELFIPSKVEILDDGPPVLFPSGLSRFDGDKTVSFIGYAVADEENEMTVSRRQRFFLGFLRRQTEMIDELNVPVISQMYYSFMQTGLSHRGHRRLLNEFSVMDFDRINIQTVGGNMREVSGTMRLIPFLYGDLIKDIVRQALSTLTRPTDGFLDDRVFTVEVLNGTTVNGLAGRTAEVLRGFGYDIIDVGNADHSGYERTVILDRSGQEEMVKIFADIIRCRNIVFETPDQSSPEGDIVMQGFDFRSDFTLIIGRDFDGRYVVGN